MKFLNTDNSKIVIILFLCIISCFTIASFGNIKNFKSDVILRIDTLKDKNSIFQTVVFNSGNDGINSYRIPSLVTTKKGSLLLFCEARKFSSKDKSPTDIALKRSTNNGKSWSAIKIIARGGNNAFMDPCALVDKITGKIFLFSTLWPADDHSTLGNTAWVIISDNDGLSWSKPHDITKEIVYPGFYIDGFGPGSGLQMSKNSLFKNRLILPTRQTDGKVTKDRTVYSDDDGITWKVGNEASIGGEFQIAESPVGKLIYNLRGRNGSRVVARSVDGGVTWGEDRIDSTLMSSSSYGGCQASIFGIGNILFYTGPAGGKGSDSTDNRQNFNIYRSFNSGETWSNNYLLSDKAAGYSCITQLIDGRLAIVFETADTNGFLKMTPGNRPPGWLRLDVMILPKKISTTDRWFSKQNIFMAGYLIFIIFIA